MIPGFVHILCALTMAACAYLLLRAFGRNHVPLLLWSGICFCFLGLSNALVFVDLILVPYVDLHVVRLVCGIAGMGSLLYGLIWESN